MGETRAATRGERPTVPTRTLHGEAGTVVLDHDTYRKRDAGVGPYNAGCGYQGTVTAEEVAAFIEKCSDGYAVVRENGCIVWYDAQPYNYEVSFTPVEDAIGRSGQESQGEGESGE